MTKRHSTVRMKTGKKGPSEGTVSLKKRVQRKSEHGSGYTIVKSDKVFRVAAAAVQKEFSMGDFRGFKGIISENMPLTRTGSLADSWPLPAGINSATSDIIRESHPAAPELKSSLDAEHIAEHIQRLDIQKLPAWKKLEKEHPGASLFVAECSSDSVEITSSGEFSTRAQLLVEVPFKYPDGFETEASMTVPAFVTGKVKNNGDIQIKEFKLSVNQPD